MRNYYSTICLLCLLFFTKASAQQIALSHQHGFYDNSFSLTISGGGENTIYYTLDGSEPTPQSKVYNAPLSISHTTILRAAAFNGGEQIGMPLTATYLFVNDVLSQSNTPEGYPATWGKYTDINGTAIADYEMDPEMTNDSKLRPKIKEGLMSLPVLSIVTDKDNLFSHENDSVKGGIYIFTGPPVGDDTGHGWTRPANVELFGQGHDFSIGCGLRLHGGHGRLAEKNPKHSFRLIFKEIYGAKTLKYPLFGQDEPSKFDQLVLRCHFGNSWQHWSEDNRQKAQYTRDVWARRMQRRMGHTSVNALYVNLFINGMYWGMYNIAERVDDQYGKDHLGGSKSDIDVIKIEESGGNHIEASEGTIDAWNEMVNLCKVVGGAKSDIDPQQAYEQLKDSLLDIDGFIDYMLINQYGGNTDWDHHNWYALRRRGDGSQGFRFLCWDSECIIINSGENVLNKNNGNSYPTGMFQNLLRNDDFARRYVRRAKEILSEDGFLGQTSAVEVWDSLYNVISKALYAEAARWGDYRRDVHNYSSRGSLYTVDGTYMAERNRLLTQYFPYRSETVLNSILSYVTVDDFEAPEGWVALSKDIFHEWNGNSKDAQQLDSHPSVDWNFNVNLGGGGAAAGFANVEYNRYADISEYEKLAIRGTGNGLRVLANRLVDHGEWKQIVVAFNETDPYWDNELGMIIIPLDALKTMRTTSNNVRIDDFLHLHVLKVDWNSSANVRGVYLIPSQQSVGIDANTLAEHEKARGGDSVDNAIYNLQGQKVANPSHGLFIINGKKVLVNKR